jgi:hypothetical protein
MEKTTRVNYYLFLQKGSPMKFIKVAAHGELDIRININYIVSYIKDENGLTRITIVYGDKAQQLYTDLTPEEVDRLIEDAGAKQ